MTKKLNLVLSQVNPVVGDLEGNTHKILETWKEVPDDTDLVIFPELAVCGYPAEDLILKPIFIDHTEKAVQSLIAQSRNFKSAALITAPYRKDGKIYNAAHLVESGVIKATILKHNLPNTGVFDEPRIFDSGPLQDPVSFRGVSLGIMICEDMWSEKVAAHLKSQGCDILIIPNASPYDVENSKKRREQAKRRAQENQLPLVYVNQVGGQDELVFDGHSFIIDQNGDLIFSGAAFQENNYQARLQQDETGRWGSPDSLTAPALELPEEIYSAVMLGLRDYVIKNNFPGVLLGLSGGIDSALAAVIAVDALGVQNVHAIMMPSRYTSKDSIHDARDIANNLGIKLDTIPVKKPVSAFGDILKKFIPGTSSVTWENIQPRVRGITLMALSNASGKMVLTTGNKSEVAAGYATLYGDMCGGFNPLKDLYKTQVYELARWRNQSMPTGGLAPRGEIIPDHVFTKAPTAELKFNQTDQDTLPPYEVLDAILHGLIEENLGPDQIIARGHTRETVLRVWKMLDTAEYKRRQAAPGTKISPRAFGRDRRYPITNKFLKTIEKSGL